MSVRTTLSAFAGVLVLAFVCYSASFSSDFQLDDTTNLEGLAAVANGGPVLDYVLSGIAGPTGRPISLTSFAAQADQWAVGPRAFLIVNTLIHLFNAVLLARVVRALFLLRGERIESATLIGCISASIWVLLPLIATASMLVVQRMTTLSALFVLLGLISYLAARTSVDSSPKRGMAMAATVLIVFTALATLAKESGILLPLYVLVLELTLLSRPATVASRLWKTWSGVFLWFPAFVIAVYLASRVSYPDYMVDRRGFDAAERLLTEANILWVYLSKALLGFPGRLGIFQGDVSVARSLFSVPAFIAVMAWLSATVAAAIWHRRYPLLALAVLWYLAGHVLESTVIPLELYFEHRNYLPIVGPIIGLVAFLMLHSDSTRKIAKIALPMLLVINVWFLYGFASLQGDPSVAARYWVIKYPDSVRANTNLAQYQLREEGPYVAAETLVRFAERNPKHRYLRILELNVACRVAPQDVTPGMVSEVSEQLADVSFSFTAAQMLGELFSTSKMSNCKAVTPQVVAQLAMVLQQNPLYVDNPQYNQMHGVLMALISRWQGNGDAALQYLQSAIDSLPSADLLMPMTTTLVESGQPDAAREFLQSAEADVPFHPLRALRWRRSIDELHNYLDAVDKAALEPE